MFKFHNESGRSMVEMLGVLAIVGVLSIGGIAGYTAAMNTQRANDTVTHALRLATLASGKRLMSPTAVLEPSELAGTDFEFANEDPDGFTLTISNLSPAVIAKINKMKTDLAAAAVSDSGNSVTFKFKNDLGEGSTSGGNSEDETKVECKDISVPYDGITGQDGLNSIQACEEHGCKLLVSPIVTGRCITSVAEAEATIPNSGCAINSHDSDSSKTYIFCDD